MSTLHTDTRPMRVVVAGGTGALGTALTGALQRAGAEAVVLTRRPADSPELLRRTGPALRFRQWDGRSVGDWAEELDRTAEERIGIVNLAGALVDARPTPAGIARLRDSRVRATEALVAASQEHAPVEAWVQGSTTAIWSDAGEARLDESSPLPAGAAALPQMTGVARPWEEAAAGAHARRTTVLRTSIVFQHDSPALDRLALLARAGLGGTVGRGDQWFSWIQLEDWLRIVLAALGLCGPELPGGILVAAAPHPVRNAELMAQLRTRLAPRLPLLAPHGFGLPTPAPVLRAGAVLLATDPALGLTGRHATSRVLAEAGFRFAHPELPGALAAVL